MLPAHYAPGSSILLPPSRGDPLSAGTGIEPQAVSVAACLSSSYHHRWAPLDEGQIGLELVFFFSQQLRVEVERRIISLLWPIQAIKRLVRSLPNSSPPSILLFPLIRTHTLLRLPFPLAFVSYIPAHQCYLYRLSSDSSLLSPTASKTVLYQIATSFPQKKVSILAPANQQHSFIDPSCPPYQPPSQRCLRTLPPMP
jgi:hypothetical protein